MDFTVSWGAERGGGASATSVSPPPNYFSVLGGGGTYLGEGIGSVRAAPPEDRAPKWGALASQDQQYPPHP